MKILADLKPYSYRRKYKWLFALSVWEILYDDTPIRIFQCDRGSIADTVLLLNAAYQEGWLRSLGDTRIDAKS